jgi:phosphate transport system substrate-binding protein
MKNAAGQIVEPGIPSFQAAAANADWAHAPGFYVVLTEQPGAQSWPIAGATFLLVHNKQPDAAKAKAMLQFFDYALRQGGDMATALHYVPLPMAVVDLVEQTWAQSITAAGQPVWGAAK